MFPVKECPEWQWNQTSNEASQSKINAAIIKDIWMIEMLRTHKISH